MNKDQKFSEEVVKFLTACGFDPKNPESLQLFEEVSKRLTSDAASVFSVKNKSYGNLLGPGQLTVEQVTFEFLRKCSRVFSVILLKKGDANVESLQENIKDMMVTAVVLLVRLKMQETEGKFVENFVKIFDDGYNSFKENQK